MHALVLLLAVLLMFYAIYLLRTRRNQAVATIALGVGLLAIFLFTNEIPGDFTGMTPYVTTLLVLALFSQRLRMPQADGQIYRKGSAG